MFKFANFSKRAIASLFLSVFCAGVFAADVSVPKEDASSDLKKDMELVFVIDKSGSMHSLSKDTIGSFNSVIEEQKNSDKSGNVYVTTVLFNNAHSELHSRVNIKDVSPMTDKDYVASGCTALLDALGSTVLKLSSDENSAKNKVMVVIITDGYENCSKEFKKEQVKKLIEENQTKNNWEFIFLGANINSVKEGGSLGICAKNSKNFSADSEGISRGYACISDAINQVRSGKEIALTA